METNSSENTLMNLFNPLYEFFSVLLMPLVVACMLTKRGGSGMTYKFEIMTQKQAENIAYNWHYNDEYSFYDMTADKEDLAEFLDPEKRGDTMFTVTIHNEVVGFFNVNKLVNHTCDIGLGMRPDLTGNGNGLEFLKAGIVFVQSTFIPEKITLSVATFNQRAINVYRKIGFKDMDTFIQDTNGSTFEFLRMVYEC